MFDEDIEIHFYTYSISKFKKIIRRQKFIFIFLAKNQH